MAKRILILREEKLFDAKLATENAEGSGDQVGVARWRKTKGERTTKGQAGG